MNSTRLTTWTRTAVRLMCFTLGLGGLIWPMVATADVEVSDSVQAGGWKSVGPAPPSISAAIAADAATHTIYLAGFGGVFLKSTDGGRTFAAMPNWPGAGAASIAMAPNDPNVVYAAGFKTTDGGATWNPQPGGGGIFLAIDPTNPNIIYSTLVGVEKSIDGGESWEGASEGLGNALIFSLAINPFHPDTLFVGTNGDGAFRSIDGGATWTPLDIDSTVWGILVDPSDGNIVYAGSNGDGVYKSIDAGVTFARVGSPEVGVVTALAKSGDRLFAATASEGVSVSEDGGVTWRNTGVSRGGGLTLSVDSAGSVYLGTSIDGAFVLQASSIDRKGDHEGNDEAQEASSEVGHAFKWRRLAVDQLNDCACQDGHGLGIDPSDHEHLFFTTNDGGLIETTNGGRTWKSGGVWSRSPRQVGFDPQQPRRVYVSTFVGGGLFKSEDHGKHWKRRLFGSSTIYTTGISVDPVDHSVYVATVGGGFALLPNGIWKSTDFGETFTRIDRAPDAPPGEFLDLSGRNITVDPHHHRTVYVGDRNTGVWRSLDAGKSWILVAGTPAFGVTVDPTTSRIVYAGTAFMGVLKSTDGGSTWTQKSNGLPSDDPSDPAAYIAISRTSGVQIHPNRPRVLYAGTEGYGVFKSTDGAETWFPVNLGLDNEGVTGLVIDPVRPDTLYASTGSSVYKTTTGGE